MIENVSVLMNIIENLCIKEILEILINDIFRLCPNGELIVLNIDSSTKYRFEFLIKSTDNKYNYQIKLSEDLEYDRQIYPSRTLTKEQAKELQKKLLQLHNTISQIEEKFRLQIKSLNKIQCEELYKIVCANLLNSKHYVNF